LCTGSGPASDTLRLIFCESLPGAAVPFRQGTHVRSLQAVSELGDGRDVTLDLCLLGDSVRVRLAEGAENPELLDAARKGEELLDRRILRAWSVGLVTGVWRSGRPTSPSNSILMDMPATAMASGVALLRSPSAWTVACIMSVR